MHLKDISRRILVNCLFRTEKGSSILLCVDMEAEDGMAKKDGTINYGYAGCMQFQAMGLGPDEKLAEQNISGNGNNNNSSSNSSINKGGSVLFIH